MGYSFPGQNPKHIAKRAALQKASATITPKQMRTTMMPFLRSVGKIFRERTREVQALNAEYGPKKDRSAERHEEYKTRRRVGGKAFVDAKFTPLLDAFKQGMANKVAARAVMRLGVTAPESKRKVKEIIRSIVLTWVNTRTERLTADKAIIGKKWKELKDILGYYPDMDFFKQVIDQAKLLKSHYDAQTSRIADAHDKRKEK